MKQRTNDHFKKNVEVHEYIEETKTGVEIINLGNFYQFVFSSWK